MASFFLCTIFFYRKFSNFLLTFCVCFLLLTKLKCAQLTHLLDRISRISDRIFSVIEYTLSIFYLKCFCYHKNSIKRNLFAHFFQRKKNTFFRKQNIAKNRKKNNNNENHEKFCIKSHLMNNFSISFPFCVLLSLEKMAKKSTE